MYDHSPIHKALYAIEVARCEIDLLEMRLEGHKDDNMWDKLAGAVGQLRTAHQVLWRIRDAKTD